MELIWKELDASRLLERRTDTVRVEGFMPTPDGRTPVGITIISPKAEIVSSSADKDGLHVTGRITVMLTCEDGSGALFAYESSASFKHDAQIDSELRAVNAETHAQVVSAKVFQEGSGARLESEIELTTVLTSSVPVKVMGGIAGATDLEVKTEEHLNGKRVVLGVSSARMREELACEDTEEVLFSEGQITVRDVSAEPGAAVVSGTLTVSAIVADAGGRPSQLIRQIPFREKVGLESVGEDISCSADLKSIWLRALGEEFGIISLEAEVEFSVFAVEKHSVTVPVDAFSPSIGFDCLGEPMELVSYCGGAYAAYTVKESIPLPETAADIASPLFAFSRALVTETVGEAGGTTVNGLTYTTIVYESSAGARHRFTEETPFTMFIENAVSANMQNVRASCITQIVGTAERSVSIQNTIAAYADIYLIEKTEPVTGLAEREPVERKSGIVLCFASEGDDLFDIAKRYSVPRSLVQSMNPTAEEPFSEGERLLLII